MCRRAPQRVVVVDAGAEVQLVADLAGLARPRQLAAQAGGEEGAVVAAELDGLGRRQAVLLAAQHGEVDGVTAGGRVAEDIGERRAASETVDFIPDAVQALGVERGVEPQRAEVHGVAQAGRQVGPLHAVAL